MKDAKSAKGPPIPPKDPRLKHFKKRNIPQQHSHMTEARILATHHQDRKLKAFTEC